MSKKSEKQHSGNGMGAVGVKPKKTMSDRLGNYWLLTIIICPFFGWFITILHGVVTLENWRVMMMVRIGVCLLIPVGMAIASAIVERKEADRASMDRNFVIGHVLFSCIAIWPAITAFRDLCGEVETVQLTVTELEATGHRKRGRRYTNYDLALSDGRSYKISREEYNSLSVAGPCTVSRLPYTDILLNVRPTP